MGKNKISVIVPIRNEEKYIEGLLQDIINQTVPKDEIEVLIVDGLSTDNTPEIVNKYEKKYSFIRLIKNEKNYVPYAMNMGIKQAKGEIIIRMDAHSFYPENYIERLVFWLKKLNAWNVGGKVKTLPAGTSIKAQAISYVMAHPFGVGNSFFRIGGINEPIEVDTVPFGCFNRRTFEQIGLYDEDLIRNQDDELNARIKKYGGKIFLIPEIEIKYYARNNFKNLMKMFYHYGLFKPLVNLKIGKPATVRQFIPLLFLLGLLIPLILTLFTIKFIYISVIIFLLHSFINIFISLQITIKNKNYKLFPFLFGGFLIVHLSYGFGYLKGLIDFVLLKKHTKRHVSVEISR